MKKKERRKPCPKDCDCFCHELGGGGEHPGQDCREAPWRMLAGTETGRTCSRQPNPHPKCCEECPNVAEDKCSYCGGRFDEPGWCPYCEEFVKFRMQHGLMKASPRTEPDEVPDTDKAIGLLQKACSQYRAEAAEWERRCNELLTASNDWKDRRDRPLPEDEQIHAAFPTRSGRHYLYSDAMRLVGARYAKGSLVALVNWLLCCIEDVEARASTFEESLNEYRQQIRERYFTCAKCQASLPTDVEEPPHCIDCNVGDEDEYHDWEERELAFRKKT